ncbi:MAG TPA: transglutaminase family protein [Polyangia bacterium]|nr:transglutaminase family protein [Polyangia bacterium]
MRRIRLGCRLRYASLSATPAVFLVQPPAHTRHLIERDALFVIGTTAPVEFLDPWGNRCQRVTLQPGESELRYDAVAAVPIDADPARADARQIPPEELPNHLLRFTLPSRYAETDKLLGFAWEKFSHVPRGWARARAICDWVHDNVEYKRGVSSPQWSAADAIARRQGVCRDRAHAVVALCRAFNMPARYAVSYLPDIDVADDGNPMDFHAYAEVWLEGGWQVFDPHDRAPRKGRVFLASGLDAADAAFATLYGGARLVGLEVWAEAIAPAVVAAPAPAAAPPEPVVVSPVLAAAPAPDALTTLEAGAASAA